MSSIDQTTNTILTHLFIKNFRNISELELGFSPRTNLFIGQNGHGKTNCLEAISLATSLKPMQTLQNSDLISNEHSQSRLISQFLGDLNFTLELDIFKVGKKAKIDNQTVKNSLKLAERVTVVSFIPSELNMIQGSASLRRRALDQAAAGLYFEHILAAKSYEKLLLNRNRLLKDGSCDKETLHAFTSLLIEQGAKMMFFRLSAIDRLEHAFAKHLTDILGSQHEGKISYWQRDNLIKNHALSDLQGLLAVNSKLLAKEELKRRVTLFGPHLDDVMFTIDGLDAKKYSSRGQSRAIVLSFKMAQMMTMKDLRGQAPIILLDDIVSELDRERKINLIDAVDNIQGQVFFSATDLETFGQISKGAQVFRLNHGAIG